jgi:hypothetical protein
MRNIDGSSWLKNPELEIVKTNDDKNVVGAAFILYADQAGSAPEPEVDPNKPKRRIAAAGY